MAVGALGIRIMALSRLLAVSAIMTTFLLPASAFGQGVAGSRHHGRDAEPEPTMNSIVAKAILISDTAAPPAPPEPAVVAAPPAPPTASDPPPQPARVATITVTNGPVPDTPENRAKYGRPMSRTGQISAPAGN